MDAEIVWRKASIQPVELLKRAKEMLGDQYWLFVGITFLGMIIGSIAPMGILMGPMFCGIYLCYGQRAGGKPVAFELLFKGFDFFVESLIAMLIMVGISLLVTIPVMIVFFVVFGALMASTDGEGGAAVIVLMPLFYLSVILLSVLISMPFLFVFPLIAERGLKAVPAIKASFQGVLANFGGMLMLVLLYTLISLVGCCLCYVPAILFLPLSFGGIFVAYREIFPWESKGDLHHA